MTPKDKPQFVATLEGLAAIKPGAKFTTQALEIWWQAMRDWPLEEFRAAASHLAKSVEFMPNPFHFEQLRKASLPSAAEEWANVLEIARGHAGRPMSAAAERALAALGGIHVVAMSETTKTHFLERRFCEHYSDAQTTSEARMIIGNGYGSQRIGAGDENSSGKYLGSQKEASAVVGDLKRSMVMRK